MIFDSVRHIGAYKGISANLDKAIDYIGKTDLSTLELGRHPISGDEVFMNVMEVETHLPGEEYHLEAHRKYLDIHITLKGGENVAVTPLETVREDTPFNESGDIGMYWGGCQALCSVTPGTFLLCMTQDAHQPALALGQPGKMKKAVVKIAW